MNQNQPKSLIISLHDLALFSQAVYADFLQKMKDIGITRATLLVVPYWHGDESIEAHPDFLAWLRDLHSQGYEICLHGHSHRAEKIEGGLYRQAMGRLYTNQEGEYYQISHATATAWIPEDLALFTRAHIPVHGFTPPAWLLSPAGYRALQENNLLYSTALQHIEVLPTQERLYAPTLVFSSRSALRRCISLLWVAFWRRANEKTPLLRLAIHPVDLKYPHIEATILSMMQQLTQSRTPQTYRDVVQDHLASAL
ncbi:MAG: polysaccharide deacetylase family protein [bacterium]|jgi:predicted deacetylase|nr:polysaccharide deacetylase family protein [bacterium]